MKRKAKPKVALTRPKVNPRTPPPPPPDAQEESFWNTPAAAARTLNFVGDSLLDEEVDVGDISAASFASPLPARSRSRSFVRTAPRKSETEPETEDQPDEDLASAPRPTSPLDDTSQPQDVDEDDEGEQTVVLSRPPPSVADPPSSGGRPHPETPYEAPSQPIAEPTTVLETPSHPEKKPKMKITTELEQIVSKIWGTIGELIMPGNPYDISGSSGSKPPRAKETIAHLQMLSTLTPSPGSPTASSISSFSHTAAPPSASAKTTAQQVLTAHMLLALLSSPPSYALPLGRLKETLASKSKEIGISAIGGSGVTRPVYGCVAKRLLKIERGGGEQLVKFDA